MYGLGNVTFADSHVKSTKGVSTSDFTADEGIVLPHLSSTLPDSSSPGSHSVDRDLSCLIDTNTVVIESFEGETREFESWPNSTLAASRPRDPGTSRKR